MEVLYVAVVGWSDGENNLALLGASQQLRNIQNLVDPYIVS
jgi:hypothetical protein